MSNTVVEEKLDTTAEEVRMPTPKTYRCSKCGASNCKLWRPRETAEPLLCLDCTAENQKKNASAINRNGIRINSKGIPTNKIGSFVPAVLLRDETNIFFAHYLLPGRKEYAHWRNLPLREQSQ